MAVIPNKMSQNRILLVANSSWYLFNFRRPLAAALADLGYEPVFVSPDDGYLDRIRQLGYRCHPIKLDRSGLNPLRQLRTLQEIRALYRREKPAAVHHFTVKCVLYGTIAARSEKVPIIVNSITGLGHLFLSQGLVKRAVRAVVEILYRKILNAPNVKTIFQNPEDRAHFLERGLVPPTAAVEIPTSGVDLRYFSRQSPTKKDATPIVFFAGRILEEKGVREFAKAAATLKSRAVNARFILAGAPDPGNPSSISTEEFSQWPKLYGVETPGQLSDIKSALEEASIFVLPSYREGGSRAILEASAMELPVVTTDVPGCRNLVDQGETGLVVPVKSSDDLSQSIEKLLREPEERTRMGKNGRKKMELNYSDTDIAARTIEVYRSLGL